MIELISDNDSLPKYPNWKKYIIELKNLFTCKQESQNVYSDVHKPCVENLYVFEIKI